MAEHLKDIVAKALLAGYALEMRNGKWYVFDPDGKVVVDPDTNYAITIRDTSTESPHRVRLNVLASLRRAGAIPPPPPKRVFEPRSAAISRSPKAKTNPILIAQQLLREPDTKPRVRRLAQAYLDLLKAHEEVRDLTQKLGKALKKRGDPT